MKKKQKPKKKKMAEKVVGCNVSEGRNDPADPVAWCDYLFCGGPLPYKPLYGSAPKRCSNEKNS
jgi:hypothetical protein